MKQTYISGKISGKPREQVQAQFAEAEKALGCATVSPLKNGLPYEAAWEEHMSVDIANLVRCDAIFMLRGWRRSRGARLEHRIAKQLNKTIHYQKPNMKKLLNFILGHKYYANVVNDMRADFIASKPFATRQQAREHRRSLMGNKAVQYVCTVTFRTREPLEIV